MISTVKIQPNIVKDYLFTSLLTMSHQLSEAASGQLFLRGFEKLKTSQNHYITKEQKKVDVKMFSNQIKKAGIFKWLTNKSISVSIKV